MRPVSESELTAAAPASPRGRHAAPARHSREASPRPLWQVVCGLLVLAVAIWLVILTYRHVPYANSLWSQFAFEADCASE